MSKYGLLDPGTCLPVLEAVCHVLEIDHALEFGCGLWSTSTLARTCANVTSVENVAEWIDKMKVEQSHRDNLSFVHYTDPMNHTTQMEIFIQKWHIIKGKNPAPGQIIFLLERN